MAELMLLHPADRLMVHLIKIPRLEARVNGMLYRARYEEKINMLEEVRISLFKHRLHASSLMFFLFLFLSPLRADCFADERSFNCLA